jgi:hypothetical protein
MLLNDAEDEHTMQMDLYGMYRGPGLKRNA